MTDFWLSCGHHLLDRDEGGGLVPTDEFLKAYFARPELSPPPDACAVERALHATMLREPRREVDDADIAAMADADARENWEVMLAFRDHLLAHPTLEAAYLALVRKGMGRTPPLFLNQLTQAILRNLLDGCDDAFQLRAAEMMFRPQRLTWHEHSLIAADEELLAASGRAPEPPLVAMLGLPRNLTIEVLTEDNAASYWARSDRFDFALDLTAGRRGQAALAEVLRRFVGHMLALDVRIKPITELKDARFAWYVGLDAEGTKIGDKVWQGEEPDEGAADRLASLFKLTFCESTSVAPEFANEAVYLFLAMTPERMLRMKPQNLVAGLPIRQMENVS